MIKYLDVSNILNKVSQDTSIIFIRQNQKGEKPPYPYITYLIINKSAEKFHRESQIRNVNETDPGLIDVNTYEKSKANVSLTFIGDNIHELENTAQAVWDYFRDKTSFTGVVRIVSPTIEDRTIFIVTYYEYRLGFDIRIDKTTKKTKQVERASSIQIQPEVNGELKETIIVEID